MLYRFETENGMITIEKAVIGKIIIEAVNTFNGKVMISNHKGKASGIVHKIGGLDEIANMEIGMGPKGLDIRIFIVIRFGTSIGMVTNTLIDEIQEKVKEFTTIEPNSVAVVVTGMISKNMARRNIEVKR